MLTSKQTLLSAFALFAVIAVFNSCDKNNENNVYNKNGLVFSGANEVPAKTTPATGTANVSYNKNTKKLDFTLTWTGLTAPVTISHIHGTASKTQSTGVKFDYSSLIPKTTSGSFSHSVIVDGVSIKEDSLLKGFYYFNIHTSTNPGGEIRTQIEF